MIASQDNAVPRFVVVGHVNRGKSSVVATLAADERVEIGDAPGTTRDTHAYEVHERDTHLYTLIDTPGFERPRQVWAELSEHANVPPDQRRRVIEDFVRRHEHTGDFEQERKLLRPILDGAAILYVVDGSLPMNESATAEMEVLRWTARPRMAVVNPIGAGDHVAAWREVLGQYFSLVRTFNAHHVSFRERLELMRALRELDEAWRQPLDEAVRLLELSRKEQRRRSAELTAAALLDLLTETAEKKLPEGVPPEGHKAALAEAYFRGLREREAKLHAALRAVYLHRRLRLESDALSVEGDDLFSESTWSRLGLTRTQLVATAAAGGAVAGGMLDLSVGGASFMAGAVVGGAAGAASAWFGWSKLVQVKVVNQPLGGRLLRVGPIRSPNFPWIVLDRAVLVHRAVAERAHARREPIQLAGGVVSALDRSQQRAIAKQLKRATKAAGPWQREAASAELAAMIEGLLVE